MMLLDVEGTVTVGLEAEPANRTRLSCKQNLIIQFLKSS